MDANVYQAPGFLHAKECEIVPQGVTALQSFAFGSSSEYGNHCPLREVKLPSSLRKIGSYAFAFCKCLEEILIPEGVEEIEDHVFKGCTSLKHISFPSTLKKLGLFCFEGCEKIERITIGDIESWGRVATADYDGWKFTNPPPSLWLKNRQLECIEIPLMLTRNVERPNPIAFRHFGNIRRVEYPSGCEYAGFDFSDCPNLAEVIFPSAVSVLNLDAFAQCTAICKMTLPKSVTLSCISTFRDSNVLRFAEAVDGVFYVGNWCVGGDCQRANIREGTEGIANGAFSKSCTLRDVIIPASVKKIGFQAFAFIKDLSSVRFLGATPEIANEAFLNVWREGRPLSKGAKVYVQDRKIFALRKIRLDLLSPPHRIFVVGSNSDADSENEFDCCVDDNRPIMIVQDPQSVLCGDLRRWFYNVAAVEHMHIQEILREHGKTDDAFIIAMAKLVKESGFEITHGISALSRLVGRNEQARIKLEDVVCQILQITV